MEALTRFNRNFAVVESLMQLFKLFRDLKKEELHNSLRLAVCGFWKTPENTGIQTAKNDQVMILAKAAAPIPESLTMEAGLNFLLRQTVVVACTALESFFWDCLTENVLTVVRARKSGADESLTELKFTLGDYISLQQYDDPDLRLRQIILKNFERRMLYDVSAIEHVMKVLTIRNFWEQVEKVTGEKAANIKRCIGDLIQRRNQIAHRADHPDDGEKADAQGLRPISESWANHHVQTARTLVTASADLIGAAIKKLEDEIQTAGEQEAARKLVKQLTQEMEGQ